MSKGEIKVKRCKKHGQHTDDKCPTCHQGRQSVDLRALKHIDHGVPVPRHGSKTIVKKRVPKETPVQHAMDLPDEEDE